MSNELTQVTKDSARGGFFLFSGAALSTVIMAISAILIGRLLGPELYGQYNLVLVIPSLILLFTDLGINVGIIKFVASLRAEGKAGRAVELIRLCMYLKFGIGLVASILCAIFAGYFALIINRPDYGFYVQLASISIIFQVIFTTANSAFVGLDKSEYNALATNVQAVTKTVLQIVLVLLSFNVTGALIGYVGGYVVASILGSAVLFFKFLKPAKIHDVPYMEEGYKKTFTLLARYGLPVYVSVVLLGFLPIYQQVVLAFFASDAVIGNFRAASNFVGLLAVIPISISAALLPAFSKLESATPKTVNTFFKRANKYTCLLIVPTTTLIILFSTQIIQLVYGSVYSSAALFLSVGALVYFLVAIGSLSLSSLFNGLGKTRLTLNMAIINFVILVALSPILAQTSGVIGVIAASLIAGTVASSYAAYVAKRRLKVNFDFKPTLRIYVISVLSAVPSLALLFFTSLNSTVILVFGALTYLFVFVTLMPLMRIVDEAEIKALGRVTVTIPLLGVLVNPLFIYQRKILLWVGRYRESSETEQ